MRTCRATVTTCLTCRIGLILLHFITLNHCVRTALRPSVHRRRRTHSNQTTRDSLNQTQLKKHPAWIICPEDFEKWSRIFSIPAIMIDYCRSAPWSRAPGSASTASRSSTSGSTRRSATIARWRVGTCKNSSNQLLYFLDVKFLCI